MKILILGDVSFTQKLGEKIKNRCLSHLFGDSFKKIFSKCDYNLINLECPITNKQKGIEKRGPNLKAPLSFIDSFNDQKNLIFCLSNNHIFDYGKSGLNDTIKILDEKRLIHIGAGFGDEIKSPLFLDDFVVLNYCEHEFSYSEKDNCGANLFDPFKCFNDIQKAKERHKKIIIIYHGGKEHYQYPTPRTQNLMRNLAKLGANLIVCQHSHCIGSYEFYNGCHIVYGQGNFIFDIGEYSNKLWYSFLSLIYDTENHELLFYPCYWDGTKIDVLDSNADFYKSFIERNDETREPEIIKSRFDNVCKESGLEYIDILKGFGKYKKGLDVKLLNGFLAKKNILQIKNMIECEPHHELICNTINLILDGIIKKPS